MKDKDRDWRVKEMKRLRIASIPESLKGKEDMSKKDEAKCSRAIAKAAKQLREMAMEKKRKENTPEGITSIPPAVRVVSQTGCHGGRPTFKVE